MRDVYRRLGARQDVLGPDDPVSRLQRRWLPRSRDARLLDAACGSGRTARAWSRLGYRNVLALDLLRRTVPAGVPYVMGDLSRLPLADSSFDYAFAGSALYYLPEPRRGIAELARVLRPGGTLVFTAHTRRSPATTWRRIKRRLGLASAAHLRGVVFHPARAYAAWAISCGLELLWLDGYGPDGRCRRALARTLAERLVAPPVPVWLARVRAEVAYHTVVVARRPADAGPSQRGYARGGQP